MTQFNKNPMEKPDTYGDNPYDRVDFDWIWETLMRCTVNDTSKGKMPNEDLIKQREIAISRTM
jgi:hypothetical protein